MRQRAGDCATRQRAGTGRRDWAPGLDAGTGRRDWGATEQARRDVRAPAYVMECP
jgi:hypothetical protein